MTDRAKIEALVIEWCAKLPCATTYDSDLFVIHREQVGEIIEAVLASVGRNAERQDNGDWLGPKDEHAVGATSAETPEPDPIAPVQDDDALNVVMLSSICGKHFTEDCQCCQTAKEDNDHRIANRLGNQSVGGK